MENTYLPSTIRDRLQDLMKEHKVTQSELATKIDSTVSVISRFLTGKTDKLSDEHIIRIARVFNVSTDFLLGVTNIPDRKNYEISELGLSVQAARNLYTGKVSTAVINRLLENSRFAELTYLIEQYLNDTLSSGFAAQNQIYTTVSSLLRTTSKTDGALQASKATNRLKTPIYQTDLTTIQNLFMSAIKEVKKEVGNDFTAVQKLNKDTTEKIFSELIKDQDIQKPSITPEQLTNAITGSISGIDGINTDVLNKFSQAFLELIQSTMKQENLNENNKQ